MTNLKTIVPHRRRREGKTNYRKRLKLLKSRTTRLVVRKSANNLVCQLVNYKTAGDVSVASSSSHELKAFGWNYHTGNLPAAYLTGLLCGLRGKESKVKQAILDTGLHPSIAGTRLYSALKGALDGGLEVPHSEEILPPPERINGKHIADYATLLKKTKPTDYKKLFSGYLKSKQEPENLTKNFEEVKKKILADGGKAKKAQ